MAKLSTRTNGDFLTASADALDKIAATYGVDRSTYFYNTKENNMNTANTVRELTVSLIDTNINLDDDNRIVYQKKGVMTTSSNEEVKMELLMSGEVKPALDEHNIKRTETIDGEFLDKHGRDVSLKIIKHISDPQLQWRFVETA